MEQTIFDTINENQYDAIVNKVKELSTRRFQYLNLANDLTNFILMQILKDFQANFSEEIIHKQFRKAIEKLFHYYYNSSFKYCYFKTRDHNLSEDIAQEAIRQLLISKNNIDDVNAWLRHVTYNLLCKHFRAQNKEKKLYEEFCREAAVSEKIMINDCSSVIDALSEEKKQGILATLEYENYQSLLSFVNLSDYADSKGLSRAVAQKRKDRIIRDLRAKILLAMGWEATTEILSFGQYNTVLRFIRNLPLTAKNDQAGEHRKKYPIGLGDLLAGVEKIDDWGITMVGNLRFRLLLFHLAAAQGPVLITFHIVLDHRNTITVENFHKNDLAATHPIPANVRIPKQMGKALWSYERIVSLLEA